MDPIKLFLLKGEEGYYPIDEGMLLQLGMTAEEIIANCEEGEGAWHEVELNSVQESVYTEARRECLLPDEATGFRLDHAEMPRQVSQRLIKEWRGPAFEGHDPKSDFNKLLPATASAVYNAINARAYPSAMRHPSFARALKRRRPGSEATTSGTPESPSPTSTPP